MKAVCLLLSVTLACGSAHIFSRHKSRPEISVQSADYIDQPLYKKLQQTILDQNNQNRPHYHVKPEHQPDQQQQEQQNQQLKKWLDPVLQYHDELRVLPEELKQTFRDYLPQQLRYQQRNQHTASAQQSDNDILYKDYSSNESLQESHEKRTPKLNQQSRSQSRSNKSWPHFYVMKFEKNGELAHPVYGDAIAWNDMQFAVAPNSRVTEEDIERIFGDAQKTMQQVSEEDKTSFHKGLQIVTQNDKDANLNATELVKRSQYPVEEHTVKTDDGYELTLFRIPPKRTIRDVQKRPVAFLMHGLLGSADDWLMLGQKNSLAYLLADAGYDVWLGNARGNKYSRRHVSKHPAIEDFWQFSNDEVALHDLPAMIDYVLNTTSQEKLNYVGYSQGTTAIFALAAARPAYNDKIIMMYALSPMVYMSNVRSPMLKMIAPTSKLYQRVSNQIGHGMFKPSKEMIYSLGGAMCENQIGCQDVCSNMKFVMSGFNINNITPNTAKLIISRSPAGASSRMIKHYGQNVASQEFRKYDYGSEINQKVYGQPQPPKYNIKNIRAPVTLYYSEEDWLAHPRDVERLEKELPNIKESYKIPDQQHFSNMDYQFSPNAPEQVYQRLIESMKTNSN